MFSFQKLKVWEGVRFKVFIYISLFNLISLSAQTDSLPQATPPPVEVIEEAAYYDDKGSNTHDLLNDGDYILHDDLQQRHFEKDFQDKYTGNAYDYSMTKPHESLWDKIIRKLQEWLSYFFRTDDAQALNNITEWVMRIIAVGIVGLVIYWLLRFLMKKEGSWFFSKKNKDLNPEARTITENIHEIDFPKLISQYETEKAYRYAIRYQYLHVLKIFTDKKILEWDAEKTNLDYIHEVADAELKEKFRRLTHIFDYVWYGEFMVDKETYEKFQVEFKNVKTAV